jgi:hypothetical protein
VNFANRHQVQEHLASLTTQGVIVELGCGYGNGVIALDKGNVHRRHIFSIDPYLECSDMCGGHYDETTKTMMLENTQGIVFSHIEKPAMIAAKTWRRAIGLLWIDISVPRDEVQALAKMWVKFILPGGYLAITGLDHKGLERDKLEFNLTRILDEQNKVMVWQKPFST